MSIRLSNMWCILRFLYIHTTSKIDIHQPQNRCTLVEIHIHINQSDEQPASYLQTFQLKCMFLLLYICSSYTHRYLPGRRRGYQCRCYGAGPGPRRCKLRQWEEDHIHRRTTIQAWRLEGTAGSPGKLPATNRQRKELKGMKKKAVKKRDIIF